MQAEKYEI